MERPEYIYTYDGPVMRFGKLYQKRWVHDMPAVSEKEALNRLKGKFRAIEGWTRTANVELDAKCLKACIPERKNNARVYSK